MSAFSFALPGRVVFGRGEARKAPALIRAHGPRGVLVHGANPARAAWLLDALRAEGAEVMAVACGAEPTLPMLEAALAGAKGHQADWVAALGGGAALDLGKALAALIPAPGGIMDHLEVVGRGLPLAAPPLPFVALPTTAGTGAEATRNAVIGLPEHGRKVSIRDERMLPRLAIVDPALTDHCPRAVTLASGLDALAQVIEPYLSCKATPFTDALVRPAIPQGLRALKRLMETEDAAARDIMAWVSLCGGMALANGGLGAVHGLAGVIGGVTPAAHGAICGALLGPVLAMNRAHSPDPARIHKVCTEIAGAFGGDAAEAPQGLARWARDAGLPGLGAQGLDAARHRAVAEASLSSSSMKGNPFVPSVPQLCEVLREAG
ncbi:iron-containing alcohol dehydrogenase [Paracoccus sp. pheM1]|uniref:iron-containing alcohol dehydrogenase n=1 Tax=Paracoccus sp. pheM1 TaxID=2831675 RepID=UPI001BDB82E4|nr:iron-containing alcohol dehydrogenase [Paracoccus sp. pheM1]MBT0780050.1 iron-containing alcohol dehydrogenase [Paracoccus sp. pheM1]